MDIIDDTNSTLSLYLTLDRYLNKKGYTNEEPRDCNGDDLPSIEYSIDLFDLNIFSLHFC
jgi:hypothetical protein